MPSPATLSTAEAILAAANELRLKRLAAAPPATSARTAKKRCKPGKPVRCSIRLPESEYRQLVKLKKRLASRGIATGKGSLVRAGLMLLANVDLVDLKVAIRDVIAPEPLLYKVK
ncbi:hypothetical protein [Accumulibacter sp.]|uniref:hypothetical protein n=1 Tax=Accumulibacter sp. TaxID=2053492 RepID=UPI0025DE4DBE|nr:hypothetical protein [Accumulibacter sp.]MCP5229259.1 hypothetical protein [Accumulibacter sp.]